MSAMVHSGLLPAAHRGFANHRRKNACGSLKGAWMPSGTKQITCYVEWTCTDYRWGNGRRLGTATEHTSLSAAMTWHCYIQTIDEAMDGVLALLQSTPRSALLWLGIVTERAHAQAYCRSWCGVVQRLASKQSNKNKRVHAPARILEWTAMSAHLHLGDLSSSLE